MKKTVLPKLKEAAVAVLPVTVIILLVNFCVAPMDGLDLAAFLVGAVLLFAGMALYTLGSEVAIERMGGLIGSSVVRTRKLPLILGVCFVIGVIVTVAEPDLTVLAQQVPGIDNWILIATVSVGVGVFMLLAVLRIVFHWRMRWILLVCYGILFALAAVVPRDFVPLAFDSGGVTTGPVTVPFIMALGIGLSAVLGGNRSEDSSFGMIGICSIGPILAVLLLRLFFSPGAVETETAVASYGSFGEVMLSYLHAFPTYLKEVGIALAPILAFFLLYDLIAMRVPLRQLIRILIGVVYTYVGLSVFLLGVNVGFLPTGNYIGRSLAHVSRWLPIPIGMVVGAVLVLAEPAVHVLNKQVEEITGGVIKRRTMLFVLSVSMAAAIGLAMLRVATGLSVWWVLAPGYAIALILTFFVPRVFTGIAFDSGGVASGPMTASFLLPLAMGAATELGGSIMTDAFGVVAFVAMTPLVALQVLGLTYRIRTSRTSRVTEEFAAMLAREGMVIDLTEPSPADKPRRHGSLAAFGEKVSRTLKAVGKALNTDIGPKKRRKPDTPAAAPSAEDPLPHKEDEVW